MYGFGYTPLISSMSKGAIPSYPPSLKLFIDAGNPLSYSGSGTAVTDLTGTQNGTLVNGVGYSSSDGGYFTFDGINDYITFGTNTAIKPTTAGTISIMAKVIDNGTEFNGTLFVNTNSSSYSGEIIRCGSSVYEGGRMVYFICSASSRLATYLTSDNSFLNAWKMFTLSWDATTRNTYVNGVLYQSLTNTLSVTNNSTNSTLLGCNVSTADFIKANISQLKIYNNKLTDAEVLNDFNAIKSRYGL